jgi:sulfur transfer protein SufE
VWLQEQSRRQSSLTADSDAILTKGIIDFDSDFSNQSAEDILEADMGFID